MELGEIEQSLSTIDNQDTGNDGTPAEHSPKTPTIQRGRFRVMSKVVLLLVVGTACAVFYTSVRPWATKTTRADLQSGVQLDAVGDPVFQMVLTKAQALHSSDGQPTQKVTSKSNQITQAINEVSDATSVEQASKEGLIVSSKMLQKLNNFTITPELAPVRLVSSTDRTVVLADMVIMKNLTGLHGRRLWAGNLWPNKNAIPYCFHPQIADSSKQAFLLAVGQIQNLVPCMGFYQVARDGDANCQAGGIFVTSESDGCWSYVGNIPSYYVQQLNLQQPGCDYVGIAAHEVLHALGMVHEQSRTDYLSHIIVYWQNIQPAYIDQYEIDPDGDTSLPYDLMSLMHYGDTDFGFPGKLTMQALDHNQHGEMGQRMGLSEYDSRQLGLMYQCQAQTFKLCTNDPTQCTYEDCGCHSDSGSGMSKTFSEWPTANCKRCEKTCPDYGGGTCRLTCGCGTGFTKKEISMSGGGVCYQCQMSSETQPSPVVDNPAPSALDYLGRIPVIVLGGLVVLLAALCLWYKCVTKPMARTNRGSPTLLPRQQPERRTEMALPQHFQSFSINSVQR